MSQADQQGGQGHARLNSVDIVKGIAILLVIFGHTEQGAMRRHWWDGMPRVVDAINFADAFIYSFHMPAFFFASGLFLAGSARRRGTAGFLLEKCRTILYPYVLWILIMDLSGPLTARFRNLASTLSWGSLFNDLISGNASWFLICLFICQLLALALLRLPYWFQMALALAGCYFVPFSADYTVLYAPARYLPFVVAGIWVGGGAVGRVERLSARVAWAGFSLLLVAQLAVIAIWGIPTPWTLTPIGLAGTAMLFLLSRGVRGTPADTVLRWFGEASIGIFLISAFFQGLGREAVARLLHLTGPLPQILVPVAMATVGPALLWHHRQKLHIGWLFRWPFGRDADSGSA